MMMISIVRISPPRVGIAEIAVIACSLSLVQTETDALSVCHGRCMHDVFKDHCQDANPQRNIQLNCKELLFSGT